MRSVIGRVVLTGSLLLGGCMLFVGQPLVVAGAEDKAAADKPVKVSPEESIKLIVYKANDSRGMAHALRLNGSVTLEFTVTTGGDVTDITPIAGDKDNALIVRYAKSDVSHYKYTPYTVNGKPTAMRTSVVISYP